MNLNRNNYEEYFILYADGELDEAGRAAVEAFVDRHPDLADELQLFHDLKLNIAPQVDMPGKAQLLKAEPWDADNLTPAQHELLLMLDGELSQPTHPLTHQQAADWALLQQTQLGTPPAITMPDAFKLLHTNTWNEEKLTADQQKLVEAVDDPSLHHSVEGLLAQPEWQKEWHLLQQTLVQPETILMPGKQKLYRYETRVVPVSWQRGLVRALAAAAVMAGLGWFIFNGNETSTSSPAVAGLTDTKEEKPPVKPGDNRTETSTDAGTTPANASNPANEVAVNAPVDAPVLNAASKPAIKNPAAPVVSEPADLNNTSLAANRLSASEEKSLRKLIAGNNNPLPNEIASNKVEVDRPTVETTFTEPVVESAVPATLASYGEPNQELFEEDKYISIAGARINKQKVKGILRSVGRTVVRNVEKTDIASSIASLK